MKKTTLFAALLCLAQSSLHADVPLFINYQGKVADSAGLPIGASGTAAAPVAAPVNRKVIFRVYDAATGGTRLWTEEQTATISLGVFSVLLGNGINPSGTAVAESHPALDTVFTPSTTSRFLEIMVDNGDNAINASDVPISPRQQITSTAFALHAKVADGIASGVDLTITPLSGTASNYGLGWYGTGRLFNSIPVDGPVLYGNSGGALGSNASGTKKLALLWNATGQVGIGATSTFAANNKLTLQGDDDATPAQQLVIRGNTDPTERLTIGFDTTGNKASLQSYTAAATAGNLLLNPSGGKVGIGTGIWAPYAKLQIGDPLGGDATTLSTSFITNTGALGTAAYSELILGNFGFNSGNHESLAISAYRTAAGADWTGTALLLGMNVDGSSRPSGGFISIHANGNFGIGHAAPGFKLSVAGNAFLEGSIHANSDIYMISGKRLANADGALYLSTLSAQPVVFQNNNAETMRISATGNVGINNATPGFPLTMASSLGDKIALFSGTTPTSYGFGIQASLLQIHSDSSASDIGFGYGSSAAMTETMRIKGNGNVGIGIASPAQKLDVNGNTYVRGQINLDGAIVMGNGPAIWGTNSVGGAEQVFWPRSSNGTYINYGSSGFYIRNNASTNTMTMTDGGIVSINGGSSVGRLNVGSGSALTSIVYLALMNTYGADQNDRTNNFTPSIWADKEIVASTYIVVSDGRIKAELHPTDSLKDLQTLMGIEVTDYHFKDKIANGNSPQKKVIAQQVEKVYPQAVFQTTGVVPDLYKKAAVKDGWVELATDLKKGERVKLIGKTEQSVHEVLEVRNGAFRPDGQVDDEQVFVYGREVKDFRTVDYDAIAMLNVSATQQLKREIKALQSENTALEAKLAAQEKRAAAQADEDAAKEQRMEARLIALEACQSKDGAPKTVSLKTAKAAR